MTRVKDILLQSKHRERVLAIILPRYEQVPDKAALELAFCKVVHQILKNAIGKNRLRKHPPPDFDCEFLFELFVRQDGRCEYNKNLHLLFYDIKDANERCHMLSIERFDQAQCYSRANVCFCCLQYNAPYQFSHDLLCELAAGAKLPVFHTDAASFLKIEKRRHGPQPKGKRCVTEDNKILCWQCKKTLPVENFTKIRAAKVQMYKSVCKKCAMVRHSEYVSANPPRVFMKRLVGATRANSKIRLNRHKKTCTSTDCLKCKSAEHELSAELIAELFDKQSGRCSISGYPLILHPSQFCSASVDRINDIVEYKRDNVRLVCMCLQAGQGVKWTHESFKRDHEYLASEI